MSAESKMLFYVRRLRWLMVAVFLFGILVQLAGQPAAFWKDPRAVVEGKPSVRFVLSHGVMPYLLCCAAYIAGAFWLASRLPGRAALVFVVGMTLVHYFGASTWIVLGFRTMEFGEYGFGFLVAAAGVCLLLWEPREQAARPEPSNEKR
jgi:hypothetical protein